MPDFVRNNFVSSKCTICDILVDEVFEHPVLKVTICKRCHESARSFGGKSQCCLWCSGQGHDMLFCVLCSHQCCFTCINKNVGIDYTNSIDEENWACFVCEPDPIRILQQEHVKQVCDDVTMTTAPEGCRETVDITSPTIIIDDCDDQRRKEDEDKSTRQYQDLDVILNVYEKQIKSSLEFDDVNIPSIINEINSIKNDQLKIAIFSYKKCLAAFMSDLTSLETRVNQAEAFQNPATSVKLTSLLKILVQHHIFNRICRPQTRIKDDHVSWLTDQNPCLTKVKKVTTQSRSSPKSVPVVFNPPKRKTWSMRQDSKDKEVHEMVTKIKNLYSRRYEDPQGKLGHQEVQDMSENSHEREDEEEDKDEDFEPSYYNKRRKMTDAEERFCRRPRSLVTPSWLADFKVDIENDVVEYDSVDRDLAMADSTHAVTEAPRRGRPPKYLSFTGRPSSSEENWAIKRSRGRPKKNVHINVKQPRFYVPKLNGESLATSI